MMAWSSASSLFDNRPGSPFLYHRPYIGRWWWLAIGTPTYYAGCSGPPAIFTLSVPISVNLNGPLTEQMVASAASRAARSFWAGVIFTARQWYKTASAPDPTDPP